MISNTAFMKERNKYYAAWQEFNAVYEEWAKTHGLSINSLLVLSAVYEDREACTQQKISRRWLIPKQTVNMILKDFARKGLVELLPMEEDKRNKRICFTPSGDEYADAILSKLRKVELLVIEEMGMDGMKQLNHLTSLFVKLFRKASNSKAQEMNQKD